MSVTLPFAELSATVYSCFGVVNQKLKYLSAALANA